MTSHVLAFLGGAAVVAAIWWVKWRGMTGAKSDLTDAVTTVENKVKKL